ncbi:MAG: hypothetical protein IKR59_03310 [Lachnospiraceae bacterium]|nr:hypothetical protein [Lachnospiraceae bacterium]
MKGKRIGDGEAGSITFESTVVVSMVLIILGLFAAFSFYLHDRIVLADTVDSMREELRVFLEEPVDVYGRLDLERIAGNSADVSAAFSYFQAEGFQRCNTRMMASEAVSFEIFFSDGMLLVQAQARFGMEGFLHLTASGAENGMNVSEAVPIREQPEDRLFNRK